MRAWNDGNEAEKCPREDSWIELYPLLGNKEAQDELRAKRPNESHCAFLSRDANACDCMPTDVDGVAAGAVCPNNAYVHKHQVFVNRDSVMDTVDRLFRLYRSAELGLVSESNLDTLATTELLTTKMELDRQSHERQKRASEQARMEAQLEADSNRRKRFEE